MLTDAGRIGTDNPALRAPRHPPLSDVEEVAEPHAGERVRPHTSAYVSIRQYADVNRMQVSVLDRKKAELGDMKKELTRLKTAMYAAKGDVDHKHRAINALHLDSAQKMEQLLQLDVKCSDAEKASPPAFSAPHHTHTHTHTHTQHT
jgi:hypothetical protein